MRTVVLYYLIGLMGLVMAGGGVLGLFRLAFGKNRPVPWRYYVMAVAMISGGLSMLGIAQALRFLVVMLIPLGL